MRKCVVAVLAVLLAWTQNIQTMGAQTVLRHGKDDADCVRWTETAFARGKVPPFSFTYGGVPSAQLLPRWRFSRQELSGVRADEALTPQEAGRFGSEELLVQGTIDCCFVEDGQWVLLDYKTDRTDDMDALRAHYEKQLNVYALALERITGLTK